MSAPLVNLIRDLRSHKLRAALTLFGITWGTVGVVLLLAFVQGLQGLISRQQHGIGEGIFIVFPSRTTLPHRGYGPGRLVRFTSEDVLRLPLEVPNIEAISPEFMSRARVTRGAVSRRVGISGVHPRFCGLRHLYPSPGGRFINGSDITGRRRVIFLGDRLRTTLFDDTEAVGAQVTINQHPFTVIGSLRYKEQNSSYAGQDSFRAYVPATTFQAVFGATRPNLFIFRAADPRRSDAVLSRVYEALGRHHQFDPSDRAALSVWDTSESERFFYYLFLALNVFMAAGGTTTLAVGGIGVANIMYIAVREHTREIGIQMAVGARPYQILAQYLTQAILLTALGGTLGFLIAWGCAASLGASPVSEHIGKPEISIVAGSFTVILLGIVGMTAGYFPARHAAGLNPVEALSF